MSEQAYKLKGTASFRRVVRPKDFEAIDASVALEFEYDAEAPVTEIQSVAADALLMAEGVVLAKLGIDGLDDSTEDEAVERLVALTGGTVEAEAPTWPEPPTFQGRNGKPIPTNDFKAWAKARHQTNPSEFYDNTGDRNPNIKHKATGIAVYL
jgi:hypothetical protein